MIKNNIEIDVKVKCIEAETTQAKLAASIGSTPPYINRLVRKNDVVVKRTFVKMMEKLGYDIELNYVKREMQEAINSAKDTEGFKKVFGDHMPTVEEFIMKASAMAKELKQK